MATLGALRFTKEVRGDVGGLQRREEPIPRGRFARQSHVTGLRILAKTRNLSAVSSGEVHSPRSAWQ